MHLTLSDLETIQQVKDFLDKEFRYQHTQASLARRFHINESKLRKGFVLVFKLPIYGYQVRLRIDKAKELLAHTDKPVKNVACLVGYDSKSLEKQFKKLTGQSPLEWRKARAEQKPEWRIV